MIKAVLVIYSMSYGGYASVNVVPFNNYMTCQKVAKIVNDAKWTRYKGTWSERDIAIDSEAECKEV